MYILFYTRLYPSACGVVPILYKTARNAVFFSPSACGLFQGSFQTARNAAHFYPSKTARNAAHFSPSTNPSRVRLPSANPEY